MTHSKQPMTGWRAWLVRHGYPELAASLPTGRRTLRRLIEEDPALAALFREYLATRDATAVTAVATTWQDSVCDVLRFGNAL